MGIDWLKWFLVFSFKKVLYQYFLFFFNKLKILKLHSFSLKLHKFFQSCTFCAECTLREPWFQARRHWGAGGQCPPIICQTCFWRCYKCSLIWQQFILAMHAPTFQFSCLRAWWFRSGKVRNRRKGTSRSTRFLAPISKTVPRGALVARRVDRWQTFKEGVREES